MENSLKQAYQVRSYHINTVKKLSAHSLLDFLQETAGLHANASHFGMHDLRKKNQTWVLSRMYFEMDRWPVLEEIMTIETWPRGIDRLFATRDFLILDRQHKQIGRASSYWLIVDRVSRRPQSPEQIAEHVAQDGRIAIDRKLEKIKPINHISIEDHRRAYYTDTDMNGHVNNVRYSEWILDSIPMEIHIATTMKSMEINYLSEVLPGQDVIIQRSSMVNNTLYASVVLKDSRKEACRSVITYY